MITLTENAVAAVKAALSRADEPAEGWHQAGFPDGARANIAPATSAVCSAGLSTIAQPAAGRARSCAPPSTLGNSRA
ncbi:hypothetical protein BFX40_10045 [Mesorhizobium sp. SEMIA 3007]|nr:hypothetical protein BFX40_10045 [Mesorhizobium sp. SEMIA 3007]